MLNKLLKEVVIITVGKQAEGIADLLNSKKHVNEFNIAKKLELTINQTRNILYKISNVGLVSSIRKKDKKKGWYTYFWKFEVLKCLEFLKNMILKNLEEIDQKIHERETKVFYFCKRCNLEASEEEALTLNFSCPECGDVFEIRDDSALIKELEKNRIKLQEKLEIVDKEMEKEVSRLDKIRDKEIKKLEKEKKEKRRLAAEKRKKSRAANSKGKTKKKVVKKKVAKKKITKRKTTKKKSMKRKPVKRKVVKKKVTKKKVARKTKKKVVKKKAAKKTKKKVSKKKVARKKVTKRKTTKKKPMKKKATKKKISKRKSPKKKIVKKKKR